MDAALNGAGVKVLFDQTMSLISLVMIKYINTPINFDNA